MKVQVTQAHIDAAVAWKSNGSVGYISENCIVARAVQDLFPDRLVSCGITTVFIMNKDGITGKNYSLDSNLQVLTNMMSKDWAMAVPTVGEITPLN